MVCNRCIMVVKSEFEKLGLHPSAVDLGKIEIADNNIDAIKVDLIGSLQSLGFELIEDKRSIKLEKIKAEIIQLVHDNNNELNSNLSDYLVAKLGCDYNSIASLFSEMEQTTIEKFYIQQKIEKVKELIIYNEMTISEIAHFLNYSSVAHLSNQFKKITGFNPSFFKQIKEQKRIQIDKL